MDYTCQLAFAKHETHTIGSRGATSRVGDTSEQFTHDGSFNFIQCTPGLGGYLSICTDSDRSSDSVGERGKSHFEFASVSEIM